LRILNILKVLFELNLLLIKVTHFKFGFAALVLVGQQFIGSSQSFIQCCICELEYLVLSMIQFQGTSLPKTSVHTTNEYCYSTPTKSGQSTAHKMNTRHTRSIHYGLFAHRPQKNSESPNRNFTRGRC